MHWQVELLPSGQPAAWLAKEYLPEGRKTQAPPDANTSDTRSVSEDAGIIAMTEAILRLISQYPGLVDKVAHTIALQPGQSRDSHFNTMMEAVSRSAPFYPGLGLAIDAALEPFSGGGPCKQ